MAKIFFSYAHEDRELVERVRLELEKYRHEVWFDNQILIGSQFPQAIDLALESCDYFFLFLTKHALESPWVRRELAAYMVLDISRGTDSILPLKFDPDADIKGFGPLVAYIQHCDFTHDFQSGLTAVLNRIGKAVGALPVSKDDYARLLFSIDLAVSAGNTAMMYYNSSLKSNLALDERKNAATFADEAAQDKVFPLIRLKYEDDVFLSEEMHLEDAYRKVAADGYTWVIDPLDGTINFVNRIPFFCSAIGLLKNGKPFIGVIFDPVLHEAYFAIEGQQSKVWRVSTGETFPLSTDLQTERLDQALIATHVSSRPTVAHQLFENDFFQSLSQHFWHVRAFGCGQLALAYIASRRLQAFIQFESFLWDQVAGVVVLKNAGGVVGDYNLEAKTLTDWTYKTKNIIACSNQSILNAFQNTFLK